MQRVSTIEEIDACFSDRDELAAELNRPSTKAAFKNNPNVAIQIENVYGGCSVSLTTRSIGQMGLHRFSWQ